MKEFVAGVFVGLFGLVFVLVVFGKWEARWTRPLTFECADSQFSMKKNGVNKTIEFCFYSDDTVQWRLKP